ncbi:MAG: hypothetical protein U5J96_14840 [Ignavibacteriaceae bacterium]|nr:hypothetical protein [Ignavibacteriaceae bacterium]
MNKPKYLFVLFLFFAADAFPQSERYTKDAENGYTWVKFGRPGSVLQHFKRKLSWFDSG